MHCESEQISFDGQTILANAIESAKLAVEDR
jgi:hypothetical protein